MAKRFLPCIVGMALFSCGVDSARESVGVEKSRLIGGAGDTADPAVVVLDVLANAGGQCTAELIASNVLLTAAHCVLDESGKALPAGTVYRFYTGPDYNAAPANAWITIDPSNVHPHPQYNSNSSAHDIAILVLTTPSTIPPLAINTQPLAATLVGSSVRLVGYGQTVVKPAAGQNDGFGVKRTLTTTIIGIQATTALIGTTGHQACSGDSGGPALLSINGVETIIATDDYGSGAVDCTTGDYYHRVDQEMAFIQPFLANAAPTPDAGAADAATDPNAGKDPSDDPSSSGAATASPTTKATPDTTSSDAATSGAGGCSLVVTRRDANRYGAPWAASLLALGFAFAAVVRRLTGGAA